MKTKNLLIPLLVLVIITTYYILNYQASVSQLKCEYMEEPLGIAVNHPRLTWNLVSKKNVSQTFFRVM
ncbi:MAG: hypothetical protein IH594_05525, partial [Bacteroidales bacterium]|nr:hypothetical protein [Bacteroidales bacterium]